MHIGIVGFCRSLQISSVRDKLQEMPRRSSNPLIQLLLPLGEPVRFTFHRLVTRVVTADVPDPLSTEELHHSWKEIRNQYFPDRTDLDTYTVVFSPRPQKRVLASCNVHRKRVLVAPAFRDQNLRAYLIPLLYHEMCHAALGNFPLQGRRRVIHGVEFKALERRHPGIKLLDSWIKSGGWIATYQRDRRRYLKERRLAGR